jgi:hypothetical protein
MKSAGSLAETPALIWQRRLFTFRSSRTHLSVAHPLTRIKYRSFREQPAPPKQQSTRPRPGPHSCATCAPTPPQANKPVRSDLIMVCIQGTKLLTDEHEDLRKTEPKNLFKTASHALSQLSYGPILRGRWLVNN